jgi:methyltransferase-like protein 23
MPESNNEFNEPYPPPEELQLVLIGGRTIHMFVPNAACIRAGWEESQRNGGEAFPYWSKIWPAALALCQWLKEHPSVYAGKTVLEMGAGLGLPSLFVATEADLVLCSDKDTKAMAYAKASANHNRYRNIVCLQINWMDSNIPLACDLLMLSDVNYEPEVFEGFRLLLQAYLAQGTEIILSTPQRLAAREFVSWLEPFVLLQAVEVVDGQPVSIFHLSG